MSQPLDKLTNTLARVDWDREVQDLIKLLVGAVLALPAGEKKRVLDKAIAPLFDAVVALKKVEKVPGEGLIVMSLLAMGYREYASRLWPPKAVSGQEADVPAANSPAAALNHKEAVNVS
jgi:hypothetical protein